MNYEPDTELLLLLATCVAVRFSGLSKVVRRNPGYLIEFKNIYSNSGLTPRRVDIENPAPEYLPYYDEPIIRRFFKQLEQLGIDSPLKPNIQDSIGVVFNLAGRTIQFP